MKKLIAILSLILVTVCSGAQSLKGTSCVDDTVVIRNVDLCNGRTYKYKGKTYYKSTVIVDSLKTINNCDSILLINLTVHPTYTFITNDTICNGYTYKWRGQTYTQSGTYYDRNTTVHGCDSIYQLNLLVQNYIHAKFTKTILNGDTFVFRNRIYTQAGTYYDTVKVPIGCDTIYTLVLNVTSNVRINKVDTICSNERYIWCGKQITQSGTYYDTLPGKAGQFDTFCTLVLTVLPSPLTVINQSICAGRSFYYRGKLISKPGIYYDTLLAANGCDSIIKMVFNQNPSYVIKDSIWICPGETHYFHGKVIKGAGIYTDTMPTVGGCDSIFIRTVFLNKSQSYDIYVHTCDHQPYMFHGQSITKPGTYRAIYKNIQGCDSVYILHYDTTPYFFEQRATICEGGSYKFHGKNITVAGVHYARYVSSTGCDSIYKLTLTVGQKFAFVTDTTVCNDVPFYWRGKQYTQSGSYTDRFSSSAGCDSTYTLNLTMLPRKDVSKVISFCQGDSLLFNQRVIKQSTNIDDTLKAASGCDSIVHYHFNMLPSFMHSDTVDLCAGTSFIWHGRTIQNEGVFYDSLRTFTGCDSIFKLTVRLAHPKDVHLNVTICQGETYYLNGKPITTAGTYYDTVYNKPQGCADTYTLVLSVNPTYTSTTNITLCPNAGFWYKNKYISQPGIYYDTLKTVDGCDSVIRIVVDRAASYFISDTATIYQGSTYNFRGRVLSQAGIYQDSFLTMNGCDSIYQLVLRVTPLFYKLEYATICDNEYYDFNGRKLNKTGVYFDSLKTHNYFDSIYELHLTVHPTYFFSAHNTVCAGNSIYFRGKHITGPGIYYDSLYTIHGCDSIYQLIFNWSNTYLIEDTAHICRGDYHIFRGRRISSPGIYYDSLHTITGCDSIYKLVLYVKNHFYAELTDTLCEGDVYDFHGRKITEAGVYYDSVKTSEGCDSIYKLTLSKYPSYIFSSFVEECYGHTMIYRGHHINKPGVYYDSLVSSTGCDSIYKLSYSWSAIYHFFDSATICVGDHYNFRGRDLTKSGVYFDSLTTNKGCDSIYEFRLTVVNVFHDVQYVDICSNEYYNFRGRYLNQSGTYYDSLKSSQGCDSIYELHLNIYPNYVIDNYIQACYGKAMTFRGIHISKPGVYYDSLLTIHGCDSVYRIIFNWTPKYIFSDTVHLCDGASYNFRGQIINNSGIYYDSLTTFNDGCDSIYRLVAYVGKGFFHEESLTICSSDVYYFKGHRVTQSGVYWDSLYTTSGCDSVYKYNITVNESKQTILNVDICSNDIFYKSDGTRLNKSGVYYDTLYTASGCDSIVMITLNVHADQLFEETRAICKGNYITWRGRRLTTAGTYYDSLVTSYGCDSVFRLTLVNNTYYNEIDTTICDNVTFRFNNRVYNTPGIYYDTLITRLGCDSVFKIDLKINPTYNIIRHLTICDTDNPIPFAGGFVHKTGVYNDTTTTVHGCDSINALYLTVIQTFYMEEDTVCEDEIYTWRGRQLTQPGLYTDTVRDQTEAHCDIIYALRLHTVQKTNLYSADIAPYICADDIEYSITPRYSGSKPEAYTVRYTSAGISKQSDIVNADFTTSPIVIPLPLTTDGDSLRPDIYTGTLELYNRICDANPQILNFTLNIRYPSYIVRQHWNDVIALLNSTYNGGYTFSKYEWYVNDILIQSITGSNMYLPNMRIGDKVEVGLTREGESYAVLTCPIWVQDLSNMEVSEYPVAIEGTILHGNTQARIIATAAGTYSLYTSAGAMLSSGHFAADSETLVTLPSVAGIYFLKVTSNNEVKTFKLLVQ